MNWIEIASIFAATIAVSFGAIGPALGEGRAVAAAALRGAIQPSRVDAAELLGRRRERGRANTHLGVAEPALKLWEAQSGGSASGRVEPEVAGRCHGPGLSHPVSGPERPPQPQLSPDLRSSARLRRVEARCALQSNRPHGTIVHMGVNLDDERFGLIPFDHKRIIELGEIDRVESNVDHRSPHGEDLSPRLRGLGHPNALPG
jgi:hypothetical protein